MYLPALIFAILPIVPALFTVSLLRLPFVVCTR